MSLLPTVGAIDQDTGFYNGAVSNSLRVNAGHTLSNTFGTPTSTTTMSFGGWFKFSAVQYQNFFSQGLGGSGVVQAFMRIDSNFKLNVDSYDGSSMYFNYITSRVFRDTSAWYHIWVQIDTTDGTNSDRVKIYVNGIRQTSFDTATHVSSQSSSVVGWNTAVTHYIGYNNASYGLNGYIADFWFLDGQDVSPVDTVGEFKNGIFIPKEYSATFGNNGFHLKFNGTGTSTSSGSVANPTNIGDDSSGQNNHWSVTSSTVASHDANLPDCPENNFCTMNFLDKGSQVDLSEGNLGISWNNNSGHAVRSTFSVSSGKWYMEFLRGTSSVTVGIAKQNNTGVSASSGWIGSSAYGSGGSYSYSSDANKYTNGSNTSYGATYSSGDVIGVAFDADNGTITFYKNGSSQGQAYSSISGEFAFGIGLFGGSTGGTVAGANFGQDSTFSNTISQGNNTDANGEGDFKYSVPTGHIALCTKNLADPTIGPESDTNSTDHHNTVLYSGNGSNSHAITGVGHQPDWLWIKRLDGSNSHVLQDSTRGKGSNDSFRVLLSNADDLEYDLNDHVRSFDSDGFTLDDDTDNTVATNNSGQSYVAWSWKLNAGTTSTNNDGSLTSTAQANTTSGVSIMTYTGGGSAGDTIGHGLGKAPTMVWFKRRGADGNWMVYVKDMGSNGYINLDRDNGKDTGGSPVNNTDPSSSVITLGSFQSLNSSSSNNTYIAYAFASIDGFSKVGNYTGNGSSDGPFVFLGFRPAWILVKNTSNANNWALLDDTRIGVGVTAHTINPVLSIVNTNTANAEFDSQSYPLIDILSNGFKIRVGGTGSAVAQNLNRNDSDLYIYLAFAHQPFKFSNGF